MNGKTIILYVESDDYQNFWLQNGDLAFTQSPTNKYTHVINLPATGINIYQQDFFISSNGIRPIGEHYAWKLTKIGINANEGARFQISDFQGRDTLWIVVDPAGAITAPPLVLLEPPRVVNILNPWETTAPKLVAGTKTIKMSTTPGRCGWFKAMLLDRAITQFHFVEVNNAPDATYGKGGFGAVDNFDLTAQFASTGPNQWLNTETNTWTAAWPNVDGNCQYLMAATVRDFSMQHPDFDFGSVIKGDFSSLGAVQSTIGANRLPVRSNSSGIVQNVNLFNDFNSWWKTDTTNANAGLRSYEACIDIPMGKSSDGLWEYDSYRDSPTDRSFFPLEGTGFNRHSDVLPTSCYQTPPPDTQWVTTNRPKRNGNFCMESHATFIYQPGQEFAFRGDDDVWVFINDKLVVDLGGIHTPKSKTVRLDTLNLTAGSEYKWDFFYCDRQPCGSSLRVKTSIYFKQQRSLDTTKTTTGNTTTFKIFKREGGKGSCAAAGAEEKIVDPVNLVYQLLNASGQVVETLAVGSFHGGITIATPATITVNPENIRDLAPGKYRIVTFEAANEKVKVEIPFTVPSRNFVEFEPPYAVDTLVSALVPVIAANREAGVIADSVEKYTVILAGGAKVYADKAKTIPVATNAVLATEITGFDTLWVTGDPAVNAEQSITLQTAGSSKVVRITFRLPPPIVVELEPPYAVESPIHVLVPIVAQTYQLGVKKDTAYPYTLTYTAGAKVYTDKAGTLPVTSGGALSTDADGTDTLWVAGDTASFADQIVTLQTANSVKQVKITFRLPPLALPRLLSAGVFDVNADGIGDSIALVHDSSLAARTPKQVSYTWPANAQPVVTAGAAILGKLDATGASVQFSGLALSEKPLTSGSGTATTTFFARGKDTSQTVSLSDKIAPILLKAEAKQGVTGDTLILTFSEPIGITGLTAPNRDLLLFYLNSDDTAAVVPPTNVGWSGGNTVAILTYAAGIPSPQPGQKVRIAQVSGGIVDGVGNGVGPNSRYRTISGVKRVDLKSIPFKEGPLTPELYAEPSIILVRTELGEEIASVSTKTGRLGHLIKIDLGDYAVKDDFNNIEPSDVRLKWSVAYFDNTGTFVSRASGDLKCTDAVFKGDCTVSANRGNIFIGWNYTSLDGRNVGTGVYVSRIKFQAFAGTQVMAENSRDERWGYIRRH